MKVGIIGLPSSGKSTLFQLMSESFEEPDYSAGNKPRLKRVLVSDPRLERLRDDYAAKKYTPAAVEILDFPGVKKDGDRGGMAEILSPAREAGALLIVLRAFKSSAIAGGDAIDPLAELEEVRGELILSDLVIVERRIEKLQAQSKKPNFDDDQKRELELLGKILKHLEEEKEIASFELTAEQKKNLSGFGFLSGKPRVLIVNAEDSEVDEELLKTISESANGEAISIPARGEVDILELDESDRAEFMEEYGIKTLHRGDVIAAAYRAAGAISFFTAGEQEVRAWTIREGETAPQAAGAIHTDFERGFIRAEVVSYEDYDAHNGVKGSKEAGVYRLEGKEYLVKDGDIIEFRFSV